MAAAAASTSMNDSLAASPQSPQSVRSNETFASSSAWSHPRSSLLLEDREERASSPREGGAGGAGGSRGETNHHHKRVSSIDSGFTNPSSYGSMFALLNSQSPQQFRLQQQQEHQLQMRDDEEDALFLQLQEERRSGGAVNSAYTQGVAIARRAWLEMDAEVEAMRQASDTSIERNCESVTKLSQAAIHLSQCPTYACAKCGTILALQDELISKAFSGRDGKAFLFFSILNTKVGPKEDRQLLTGLHTVADLSCMTCHRGVGWCYLRAFEASQRYKEGKFILERAMLHKCNNWQMDS